MARVVDGCVFVLMCISGLSKEENIALNKHATQSGNQYGFGPENAVDGILSGYWNSGFCSFITPPLGQNRRVWWMVDFGHLHHISNIVVYGGNDGGLQQYSIRIGNSSNVFDNSVVANSDVANTSQPGTWLFPSDKLSRNVGSRVALVSSNHYNIKLCEVIVNGRIYWDCSSCPPNVVCDNIQGCRKCFKRFAGPECKVCKEAFTRTDCCSEHCKHQLCARETGVCTDGCEYEINGDWWIGDTCGLKIPLLSFGGRDNVSRDGVAITSSSVTWQWKEWTFIDDQAAVYIGYQIYFRPLGVVNWTIGSDLPYTLTEWQQGTVSQLQSNTQYEFDIKVYRVNTDGEKVHSSTSYIQSDKPALVATTKASNTGQPGITTTLATRDGVPLGGEAPLNERPKIPLIAGVVVGVVLVLSAAGIVLFFLLRRRKEAKGKLEGSRLPVGEQPITQMEQNMTSGDEDNLDGQVDSESKKGAQEEVIYANQTSSGIGSSAISLADLKSFILRKSVKNGFKMEFDLLPDEEMLDCKAASLARNTLKNRFKNIKAYDSTRVVLKDDMDQDTDYINANYITGYRRKKNAYVATQAPNKHTTTDFWKMIWQLKANRIAMLTRTFENGKSKSEQYWSMDNGGEKTFGNIAVRTIKTEEFTDYAMSILSLTKEDESRTVRHLQFLRWPDKSAPEHAFPLLAFRRKVRSFDGVSRGPMIVHCSAGIGRTGTFIALDYLLQQIKTEAAIDAVALVNQMRTERMKMVQTQAQYEFIFVAVLDAITTGDTALPCNVLQQSQKKSGANPLQEQFSLLDSLNPSSPVGDVEEDKHRPKLVPSKRHNGTYVNAVFVDDFRSEQGIIATQMPLPNTIEDFWRLVYQHRRTTIVMLNPLEKYDEKCAVYWPDEEEPRQKYGDLDIKFISADTNGSIITRIFHLTKITSTKDEPMIVSQLQLLNWPKSDEIPDVALLLDLADNVARLKQSLGKDSVLVHCSDGATRCGLFCAASYMLEKMKADQEVDVFLAVRCVSLTRPQFVSTEEQYLYLYDVATECSSVYQNL